jgi:RNA polymerase sigma factor (sigma-70 family)
MINVEEHLKLVHYVLRHVLKISAASSNYEDFYQIGCLGLIKAAKRFNPQKGYEFSSFAIPNIEGYIKTYKREDQPIKFGRTLTDKWSKYQSLTNKGYSDNEIAKKMNMTDYELRKVINAFQLMASLDYEIGKCKKSGIQDIIAGTVNMEDEVLKKVEIQEKLKLLEKISNHKHIKIIKLMFKDITNQIEIGNILGISQAEVSRCLKQIRNEMYPAVNSYIEGKISYNQFLNWQKNKCIIIKNQEDKGVLPT